MKTLEEFASWLEKAQKDEDEQLPFVWEIMGSPYVEFHYSAITDKDTNDEFRGDLWHRFDEHGEEGASFLLSKLDGGEDADFQADIIFCLGKMADERGAQKERVLAWARKLADSPDGWRRNRAIIVLGWIGQMKDIPLLAEHLLHDADAKCRAWSATSFMQMWFRRKSRSLVEKALPLLRQALRQETDHFAVGCMVDVVQTLTQKRFGLSQKAIDHVEKEKIDAAKSKVERYFQRNAKSLGEG
jgi:hypothetical protein